ncbi:MAG: MSMEG_0565 family glycosyltransferase [Cyanothece sp. SIO1E1]|nr:MSMEG_0565 family glycosyltransferase [Cyanothece sp. SIO1E1]
MKIALLTYSTQPRGSVIHTLELGNALTQLGHQVCIYALDKDGRGFDYPVTCEVRRVPTQRAPADIDLLIRQRIQEFIDDLAIAPKNHDIYHAQDCIGANALLALRAQGKIPHFIRTVHHVEDYQSPYLQQCQDKSIREPNLCLCVSDRWQQALYQDYQITAPRVFNGVNMTRFSARPSGQEIVIKQTRGLTGAPIYLTVGGIEPRKNSIRLLTAFAQVLRTQPQAQLVIAGGATLFDYQPYRDQFFQVASQLGIEVGRSLVLPGVIPDADLPGLYRCADVFCLPSLKEGWGLVVLEAIACGLPVLLSHQPPFTEFLLPEQASWVDPESSEAIAQGMLAILDPDLVKSITQTYPSILPRHSWQHSARVHIDQYQILLNAAISQ